MAIIGAFRQHKAKVERSDPKTADIGVTRYRREKNIQKRDKVVVLIGTHFGVFRSFEFGLLAGICIKQRAILGDTVDSVLERCGVVGPTPKAPNSS